MSRGLNRSGDFRNGTPVTLPHKFGNPITLPHDFGNEPPFGPGNLVTWTPSPAHFGNIIGGSGGSFLLQADGASHFLLADLSGAILVS